MHVSADLSAIVLGVHELVRIWLDASLIKGVLEVVFSSVNGTPFLNSDQLVAEYIFAVDIDQVSISLVGNTTTIVGVGNQGTDSLPVNGLVGFEVRVSDSILEASHVDGQYILTDGVIRVVESIRSVETEGLELLSLNEHSMEPHQTEASLAELHVFLTLGESLVHVGIHSDEVRLDSTWGLSSHLDGSLEERDRESRSGRSGHEDSEAGLEIAISEHLIHNVFKLGKEVDREMTITQEAPVSIKGRLLKHALGTFSLSLTKGDRHHLNLNFFSESLELFSGINTRSHDEDDRGLRGRLFIDLLDGGGLSTGEVSSLEVGVHEVNDRKSDSVGSEAPEDDHLLHVIITLALPFSRKLSLLGVRFGGREPAEPLFSIELDSGSESLVEVNLLL